MYPEVLVQIGKGAWVDIVEKPVTLTWNFHWNCDCCCFFS